MVQEQYNFVDAYNFSTDTGKYFFVSSYNNYIIVINTHISVWEYHDGRHKLLNNILHSYEFPSYRYLDGCELIKKVKTKVSKKHAAINNKYISFKNIKELNYIRIVDKLMPDEIVHWYKITTDALEKFNNIYVIEDNIVDCDLSNIKRDIVDLLFKNINYNNVELLLDYVDRLYDDNFNKNNKISNLYEYIGG